MTSSVYVLLLVFFLHGGIAETLALTQPTLKDCQAAEPLVVNYYKQLKTLKIGQTDIPIEQIKPVCIEVDKL